MNVRVAAALAASALSLPLFAADSCTVDPRHTFPSFEVKLEINVEAFKS